jgi:ribosomal protein L12E/L44/L45/RPP1/RPP2
MVWAGGEWQTAKDPATNTSLSSVGATAGVRADLSDLSIVVSAYTGKGIGHVLGLGANSVSGGATPEGRPADGGYAQATYKMGAKATLGLSYGVTRLKGADDGAGGDVTDALLSELQMFTGGVYYQWTKSLKLVGEVSRERNDLAGGANRTDVSGGFMLFF